MKSYTDIKQSKKLAEILPLESADICYVCGNTILVSPTKYGDTSIEELYKKHIISAWSLAALLGVIPYNVSFNKAVYCFKLVKFSDHWECYYENFGTVSTEIFKADNSIDACVAMIEKLHELKML